MFVINNNEATFRDKALATIVVKTDIRRVELIGNAAFGCKCNNLISKMSDYFNNPTNITGGIHLNHCMIISNDSVFQSCATF
jgi:hypothetical protein